MIQLLPDQACFIGPSDPMVEGADPKHHESAKNVNRNRDHRGCALAVVDQRDARAENSEKHGLVKMSAKQGFCIQWLYLENSIHLFTEKSTNLHTMSHLIDLTGCN